jgi:hypothetical protein
MGVCFHENYKLTRFSDLTQTIGTYPYINISNTLPIMRRVSRIVACSLLFSSLTAARGPYTSLGDLFQGQLANLTSKPPGNVERGGQSFEHCCNLAINQSLEIDDGYAIFRPGQTFLAGNVSTFLEYQYPCDASYNGTMGDQPQVNIPYSWCHQNCGGWEIKTTALQSNWVEPFVGFILPTIVFCFTVPRRRAILTPRRLFPEDSLFQFPGNLTLLYKLPFALVLDVVDTFQWVVTCITMAGPMLLSGMLEVLLDSKMLDAMEDTRSWTVRQKAHFLYIVLIGNLDEDPAWPHSVRVVSMLPNNKRSVKEINSHDLKGSPEVKNNGNTSAEKKDSLVTIFPGNEGAPRHNLITEKLYIGAAKCRLISLLESQAQFGTSVGIGVVFFVASFLYSIGQIESAYGNG